MIAGVPVGWTKGVANLCQCERPGAARKLFFHAIVRGGRGRLSWRRTRWRGGRDVVRPCRRFAGGAQNSSSHQRNGSQDDKNETAALHVGTPRWPCVHGLSFASVVIDGRRFAHVIHPGGLYTRKYLDLKTNSTPVKQPGHHNPARCKGEPENQR